jgi:hypothetical protein
MVKVTVELDDKTAERLAEASRAAQVSIEEILRRQAEGAVQFSLSEFSNHAHCKVLAALLRPEGYYETARDQLYDRERDRAEMYMQTRKKLLSLIDETAGDMGSQTWSRASLYER